ncbi:MAG: energy transducer TonB, partial [Myxococcales bacterium]|nr:energy transducer TonB [Myxococcales bacterium]
STTAPGHPRSLAPPRDPLAAVARLGRRASRDGIYVGFIIAILSHFGAYAAPEYSMWQMSQVVGRMQRDLHGFFLQAYDVEMLEDEGQKEEAEEEVVDETEDEAEDEAEDEPDEAVETPTPTPTTTPPPTQDDEPENDDPYPDEEEAAPDTAEAPDVMTAPDTAPVDLTGENTFVTKPGSQSTGGGLTSKGGSSKTPVRNKNARSGGKGRRSSKGSGTGKRKRSGGGRDLSRGISGNFRGSCPFPPQADLNKIDKATVQLSLTVGPDGRVLNATVVGDPGYGFGAAARRCVMAQTFPPPLDSDGKPTTITQVASYHFNR